MHSSVSLSSLLPFFSLFILAPLASCDGDGIPVEFPFWLAGSSVSCRYPGFNLSCKSQQSQSTMTILTLPPPGEFAVGRINYTAQTVLLNDPLDCPRSQRLNFTLAGQPVKVQRERNFTFLNCSNDAMMWGHPMATWIPCMSRENYYTVVSLSSGYLAPSSYSGCEKIKTVSVPVQLKYVRDLPKDVLLTWVQPDCKRCVADGGDCGWKSGSGSELTCRNIPKDRGSFFLGLPRSAKYGVIIGVVIPGVLFLLGLGSYVCRLIGLRSSRRQRHPSMEFSPALRAPQFCAARGLDRQTIESYPKTMLGASWRLPKPNDNACPICLCEYKPSETLRTIPECNHYFHVDCIDEWLMMNSTCPLCRNSLPHVSPSGASLAVPASLPPSSPSASV